jgi:pimeloyl-ACP methyl ester carboxylesterase
MTLLHLLLLPGLACDAEVWENQASTLAAIRTIGIADYGASDSIQKMAQVALDGAPERFALAGHSMGGRVALEIMRCSPGRVEALALIDTASGPLPSGEAGEHEKTGRVALVEIARTRGMRAMARQWVQDKIHPERLMDGLLIASIIDMMSRKTPEVFAAQTRALLDRPNSTPVLPGIRCPTLVLCGREDVLSPVELNREMVALIPESKLVVIENCGHMATMEHPEKVTAAMAEWLEGSRRLASMA